MQLCAFPRLGQGEGRQTHPTIDGFQSREEMAIFVYKTKQIFAHVVHYNRDKSPKDRFLNCSVHKHGCCDVR